MSDRVTQSYSDCDGKTGKSVHSIESVWMAHWTRTSYNAMAETHNNAHTALGNKENDQDSKPLRSIVKLETMSELSKSVKRLRESETQTFEVINESMRTSSRTIAKETLGNWSLPLHNTHENIKTPFQNPLDCVKTHSYDIGRSIIASSPLLDNPNHLASHLVAYRDPTQYITKEGENTQKGFTSKSLLATKEEVPRREMLEHEHGRSITPSLRQNDTCLLDAPSTSRKLVAEFGGEEFQKIAGGSFIRLLENEPTPSHLTKSKLLDPCSCNQQKPPHSMLISKGTNADLLEGNNVIGNSMWSEMKRKASSSNCDSPSKYFGQGGMKLQIQNCRDIERKENIEDSKPSEFVLKNESSAETDNMDMNVFQEKNQLCGISSSIVKKVNKIDQNSPGRLALNCSRKEETRYKQFKLDINLELPAPTDNMETSTSRTESLDLGSILARPERPNSSRTDLCPEGLFQQDPGSRWVKRLKLSDSCSLAFGTKNSGLVVETSHEKSDKLFSKIPKATASSKRPGKELMVHDNTPYLAMNSSPSSMSVIKKDMELLTSHSWIQRLLHDRATTAPKRPQSVVLCEPQSSKLELDDFRKKQLPSLGAMALMGKAMNGFHPCEFHRKGSLVVWNTKSF